MLVPSQRHRPDDLEAWAIWERADAANAVRLRPERAADTILRFAQGRRGYVGVSWGKDSTVLADICCRAGLDWPLVWVRVEPIANPDCHLVRDRFIAMHPGIAYDEIEVCCWRDADGVHARGTLERGFSQAVARYGPCHISGVRADESGPRKRRMATFGCSTERTCAPLGWWRGEDVYAYLHSQGLPVHPAYACTFGGLLDRARVRVASLTGQRGTGHGRYEWEDAYYHEALQRIARWTP